MLVVTGASGFLGRAIVTRAMACGFPVTAVSRRPRAVLAGVAVMEVADYAQLMPPVSDSVLIHLAEESDIARAEAGAADHLARMQGAFASLAAKKWKHVLYASSGAVYGDQAKSARREEDPVQPAGYYGRSKLACEEIAVGAGGTALRLGNLYGAGMPRRVVVSDIVEQIGQAGPIRLRDLSPVRDFVHVDDVAAGFIAAADQQLSGIYNVGTGVGTSVRDLARVALSLAGEAERSLVETNPQSRHSHIALDSTRMAKASGWRPAISLEQGLRQLLGHTP